MQYNVYTVLYLPFFIQQCILEIVPYQYLQSFLFLFNGYMVVHCTDYHTLLSLIFTYYFYNWQEQQSDFGEKTIYLLISGSSSSFYFFFFSFPSNCLLHVHWVNAITLLVCPSYLDGWFPHLWLSPNFEAHISNRLLDNFTWYSTNTLNLTCLKLKTSYHINLLLSHHIHSYINTIKFYWIMVYTQDMMLILDPIQKNLTA